MESQPDVKHDEPTALGIRKSLKACGPVQVWTAGLSDG